MPVRRCDLRAVTPNGDTGRSDQKIGGAQLLLQVLHCCFDRFGISDVSDHAGGNNASLFGEIRGRVGHLWEQVDQSNGSTALS